MLVFANLILADFLSAAEPAQGAAPAEQPAAQLEAQAAPTQPAPEQLIGGAAAGTADVAAQQSQAQAAPAWDRW